MLGYSLKGLIDETLKDMPKEGIADNIRDIIAERIIDCFTAQYQIKNY